MPWNPLKSFKFNRIFQFLLPTRSLLENFIAVFPPEKKQSRKKKEENAETCQTFRACYQIEEEEGDEKKFAYSRARASNSLFMSVRFDGRRRKTFFSHVAHECRGRWKSYPTRILLFPARNQLENYKFFSISSILREINYFVLHVWWNLSWRRHLAANVIIIEMDS